MKNIDFLNTKEYSVIYKLKPTKNIQKNEPSNKVPFLPQPKKTQSGWYTFDEQNLIQTTAKNKIINT